MPDEESSEVLAVWRHTLDERISNSEGKVSVTTGGRADGMATSKHNASPFVQRLVDGVRGLYDLLRAHVDDAVDAHVDQQRLAEAATLVGEAPPFHKSRALLLLPELRTNSAGGSPPPLQRRQQPRFGKGIRHHPPLHVCSLTSVALRGAAACGYLPLQQLQPLPHPQDHGLPQQRHYQHHNRHHHGGGAPLLAVTDGELPLPSTAFRGLVVFFRRNVAVTMDVLPPPTSDTNTSAHHAGMFTTATVDHIGRSLQSNNDAPQLPQHLPPLHSTTRRGDIYIDSYGIVYFSAYGDADATTPVPDVLDQDADGGEDDGGERPQPSASNATGACTAGQSSTNACVVAFLPCIVESRVFPHNTLRRATPKSSSRQLREEQLHVQRLATGSWAAVTAVPPEHLLRHRPGGRCVPADSNGGLNTLLAADLGSLASLLHDGNDSAIGGNAPHDAQTTNDDLINSPLSVKASAYAGNVHRKMRDVDSGSIGTHWLRAAVVVDFDVASALEMSAADHAVSSMDALDALRKTMAGTFSTVRDYVAALPAMHNRSVFLSSADLRAARRSERQSVRGLRDQRRGDREQLQLSHDHDVLQHFLDDLGDYGAPWASPSPSAHATSETRGRAEEVHRTARCALSQLLTLACATSSKQRHRAADDLMYRSGGGNPVHVATPRRLPSLLCEVGDDQPLESQLL